jgi:hypothetical protein
MGMLKVEVVSEIEVMAIVTQTIETDIGTMKRTQGTNAVNPISPGRRTNESTAFGE